MSNAGGEQGWPGGQYPQQGYPGYAQQPLQSHSQQPQQSYPGYAQPQQQQTQQPGQYSYPQSMPAAYQPMPQGRPPKKRGKGLAIGITVAIVGVLGLGGVGAYAVWQNEAKSSYAHAVADYSAEDDRINLANQNAETVAATAESKQLKAADILAHGTIGQVDTTAFDNFSAATIALEDSLIDVPSPLAPLASLDDAPGTPWELVDEAQIIEGDADSHEQQIGDYESAWGAVSTKISELDAAAVTLFGSAANQNVVIDDNPLASSDSIQSFVVAQTTVTQLTTLDQGAVDAYNIYVDAAGAVAASQADAELTAQEQEEAEEELLPDDVVHARDEVEAFAKSLAPGVEITFSWAPTVNGYGTGNSIGGYTTWWMSPPRAHIELSDSAATMWGGPNDDMVRALVAHEVGHAITVRCGEMYDWSTQANIEEWATAWAISLGYTADGNGVSIYGQPSQAMIDAAAQCR